MGPYGSVGAHIKTGRSPMAHDHFQTPPGPKRGHTNPKLTNKPVFSSGEDTTQSRTTGIFVGSFLDFYRPFFGQEGVENDREP